MKTLRTCWLAIVVFAGAALSALATDYNWRTDIGGGDWNDTSKWSPSTGVPGASDIAYFQLPQTSPFTVSFTNDVSTRLSLGSTDATRPAVVTFDLNGHTLTHLTAALDANRALDWTILDGTILTPPGLAYALNNGYYQTNFVPKVTIGAGGAYVNNGGTYVQIGSRSAGELVIRDGGKLITQQGSSTALRLGSSTAAGYTNYTAKMTVTGAGSVWSNLVGLIYLSYYAQATAEMKVTDYGSIVNNGSSFIVANTTNTVSSLSIASGGSITHNGSVFTVGGAAGANGSMDITSGGLLDARGATNYMIIANNGTGTVVVTGTDSKLLAPDNSHFYLGNVADTAQGTLIIEKGGLMDKSGGNYTMFLGNKDNAIGRVIVRDGGLLRWAGGQGPMLLGGQGAGSGAIGELIVTGATSRVIAGEFVVGQNRGYGSATVSGGGTLEIYRTMYVGRIATNSVSSHNGLAKIVVTGTGSVLKKSALTVVDLPSASISLSTSLGLGGCGYKGWTDSGLAYDTVYGPGGKGEAVIENGGLVSLNAYISVYPNSKLWIDGGRTESAYIGLDTNSTFNAVLRAGDANGSALMTATSEVRLWGAKLDLGLGADFAQQAGDVYTLISGPLHATINRFTYNGSRLQDGDVIEVGGTSFKVAYTANAVTLTVRQTGTLIKVL